MNHNSARSPLATKRKFSLTYLFILITVVALSLVPVVYWGSSRISSMSPRTTCSNNLKQIALAIHNYADLHGQLPPPYTEDDSGTRLHSWRVLILPYLEHQALFDQFDLDKPWNHPDNIKLATKMPEIYRCPSFDQKSQFARVTTAYVVLLGHNTPWPHRGGRMFSDITDGLGDTIAVLESEPSRLHWMSPTDPVIESIGPYGMQNRTMTLRGPHQGVSCCAYCDGRVGGLSDNVESKTLRALGTINGRETIDVPDY